MYETRGYPIDQQLARAGRAELTRGLRRLSARAARALRGRDDCRLRGPERSAS